MCEKKAEDVAKKMTRFFFLVEERSCTMSVNLDEDHTADPHNAMLVGVRKTTSEGGKASLIKSMYGHDKYFRDVDSRLNNYRFHHVIILTSNCNTSL